MGSTCSHRNYTMDGERSDHSSHDNGSTVDDGTTGGYRPPLRAMQRSSGEATCASLCSIAHHRATDSAMAKQACRQASRYHGPAACADTTQAHARRGEDPDDGLHLHSSSG
jgi:hypothetical protein